MGTLAYGKSIDLRLEDFFILVLLAFSFGGRVRLPRTYSVLALIIVTICSAFFSTFLGALAGWIEPIRAVFFIAKELEYYLLFVLTLRTVRAVVDVWALVWGFFLGAIINGAFVLYQFGTGQYFGRETNDYGVVIFGEHASFNVSAYGGFVILIAIGLLEVPGFRSKLLAMVFGALGAASLLGGLSRTALIAMAFTGVIWIIVSFRTGSAKKTANALLFVALLIAAIGISYEVMLASGRENLVNRVSNLTANNIEANYTTARIDVVYREYFAKIPTNLVTGLGWSITGTDLPIEAHNHFLRVLAEGGILGLLLFLAVLFKILSISYQTIRRAREPELRAVALCSFLYAVFLTITSVAQDTFISARVTEIFWISFAVVLRIHQWSTSGISQRRFQNVRPRLLRRPATPPFAVDHSAYREGHSEMPC